MEEINIRFASFAAELRHAMVAAKVANDNDIKVWVDVHLDSIKALMKRAANLMQSQYILNNHNRFMDTRYVSMSNRFAVAEEIAKRTGTSHARMLEDGEELEVLSW